MAAAELAHSVVAVAAAEMPRDLPAAGVVPAWAAVVAVAAVAVAVAAEEAEAAVAVAAVAVVAAVVVDKA